jgi:NhaP-type Na+/H+ or K+/H+ antiporter
MYDGLAILALFVFIYSIIGGRVDRSVVSGPIVFVTAGIIMGPMVLGWFEGDEVRRDLRLLADLTLALILFVDAAHADLTTLKKRFQIPLRMLLLGLPAVILLGFGLALVIFDTLTIFEAAILGTMLAATDAALGKAVITNKSVPARLRESLNVESGLNDGLCVPILFVLIALALDSKSGSDTHASALGLVAQELGIGALIGIGMSAVGALLYRFSLKKGWVTDIWMQATVAALALTCFASAQYFHGSGYIASFAGGITFGLLAADSTHKPVLAAEGVAETLALLTWLLFGVSVIGQLAGLITWQVFVYALISLTVIRVLPIFLSLTGSGEPTSSRLFLGWFGPRGLASIVFAVIVLDYELPGAELISLVVVWTVFLSLIAHGVSAVPLSNWIAGKERERENRVR